MATNAQYEAMRFEIACLQRDKLELCERCGVAEAKLAAAEAEVTRLMHGNDDIVTVLKDMDELRGMLAFEVAENTRWEGVCDELEQQVNEARAAARDYYSMRMTDRDTDTKVLDRWPWLADAQEGEG